MSKLTNEENILKLIIDKFNNSKTNVVSISKSDLPSLSMSESEVTRSLCVLQSDGMLKITQKSIHDDLSVFWSVELNSLAIHYFENKEEQKREKRNNWIQFWIPVTISIIALIFAA